MRELSCVAENLRLVQNARRRFLEFWAVERGCINPMLDRMAEALLEHVMPEAKSDSALDPPDQPGEMN